MTADMETIRRAVTKHHGGFERADDADILALWRTVPEARKRALLAEQEPQRPEAKGKRPTKPAAEGKSARKSKTEGAHDADTAEPQ